MFQVFDPRQLGHSPALELHNGGWVDYAEKVSRAEIIAAKLGPLAPARDFGMAPLERVHSAEYLEFLSTAHERWLAAGRSGDAVGYTWPVVGRRSLRLERIDALLGRFSYDAGTPIAAGTRRRRCAPSRPGWGRARSRRSARPNKPRPRCRR